MQDWALFNASPDILQQIRDFPELQPGRRLRDTAIGPIVLMDAQIDHTTGLYMLRERSEPLQIWCTEQVHEDLTRGNPIFRVLEHFCGVRWNALPIDGRSVSPEGIGALRFTALPLASKAPPYSPHRDAPHPGDNIGMTITDTGNGRSAFYAPGLAQVSAPVWQAMQAADCVLVDGTFWTDDEMSAVGVSAKRALDLGHLPQSGPEGMIHWLDRLPAATRRLLIHINNTNPILDEDSPQRALLQAHHIDVCHDGLDIAFD